jgi:hypothetical protein
MKPSTARTKALLLISNVALSFALLTGFASCSQYPELKILDGETCFTSVEHSCSLLCEDTLYPDQDPRREYERALGPKDVVTNSNDYFKYRSDFLDAKVEALSWKKKYEAVCKLSPKVCQ